MGSGSPAFSATYNGFGMREGKSANVYWSYEYGVEGTSVTCPALSREISTAHWFGFT